MAAVLQMLLLGTYRVQGTGLFHWRPSQSLLLAALHPRQWHVLTDVDRRRTVVYQDNIDFVCGDVALRCWTDIFLLVYCPNLTTDQCAHSVT